MALSTKIKRNVRLLSLLQKETWQSCDVRFSGEMDSSQTGYGFVPVFVLVINH